MRVRDLHYFLSDFGVWYLKKLAIFTLFPTASVTLKFSEYQNCIHNHGRFVACCILRCNNLLKHRPSTGSLTLNPLSDGQYDFIGGQRSFKGAGRRRHSSDGDFDLNLIGWGTWNIEPRRASIWRWLPVPIIHYGKKFHPLPNPRNCGPNSIRILLTSVSSLFFCPQVAYN